MKKNFLLLSEGESTLQPTDAERQGAAEEVCFTSSRPLHPRFQQHGGSFPGSPED